MKKTLNRQELLKEFNISESTLNTNFPRFCQKQLQRGLHITRQGKGANALFIIEEVKPQLVDKAKFSTRPTIISEEIAGEVWKTIFCEPHYEVSNKGRIRNKQSKALLKGSINKSGYVNVSIMNKHYQVHRLVLQTFNPIDSYELYTVDHINGIRSDNNLENLRWVTLEDNINAMITNRKDLNIELTRIIQKFGYEKTLQLLQNL